MIRRLGELLGLRRDDARHDGLIERADLESGAPPGLADAVPEPAPRANPAPAPVPPPPDAGAEAAPAHAAAAGEPALEDAIVEALRTVYDPEIPTNIYELGLVYDLVIDEARNVVVKMTLTAPGCPVAGEMPGWVHEAVASVEGVGEVEVELVWDPPWDPSMMSEVARLETGFFY